MANKCIAADRILSKLDEYLNKNDYPSAERHLKFWLSEASQASDISTELLIQNELMGLYRKLGKKQEAFEALDTAINKISSYGIGNQVGAATTYLNAATVYKAFDLPNMSIPLFEKAKTIYESELEASDSRLAGLYNNMALALVDLKRFSEANKLYESAISILKSSDIDSLEIAITYLNMASAAEAEFGLLDANETIDSYLKQAKELLEKCSKKNGYYAFVCEKCASVFGYYGYFLYENELKKRARRIYEGA